MSMCLNTVVAMRTSDIISRIETMPVATTLSQGRFTQGPSTSLSLHSIRRKTVALGRRTPARAWTPVVMTPSGAPGMITMAAASTTMAVKAP